MLVPATHVIFFAIDTDPRALYSDVGSVLRAEPSAPPSETRTKTLLPACGSWRPPVAGVCLVPPPSVSATTPTCVKGGSEQNG